MEENFPAFQWSKMSGDKAEQIVVRANTLDEFFKRIREAEQIEFPRNQNVLMDEDVDSQKYCATCGKPAIEKKGTGKNGKPYHALFCSSDIKSHTVWL